MRTIEAFSKQFFGARYESIWKSLLMAGILFVAIYAAEFRVAIAPCILYLTSAFFPAGILWQALTGRRHMEILQGMLMLPFDNRGFVFSYVLVLGTHTLLTKTLPVWMLFFAAASWGAGEIALAVFCGCMACAVTAAGYRMCRKGHAALPILWAVGILAVILLVRQWAAVLAVAVLSFLAAALYLAFADAYDFCGVSIAKKAGPEAHSFICYALCWQTRAILSMRWACARWLAFCRCCLANFRSGICFRWALRSFA